MSFPSISKLFSFKFRGTALLSVGLLSHSFLLNPVGLRLATQAGLNLDLEDPVTVGREPDNHTGTNPESQADVRESDLQAVPGTSKRWWCFNFLNSLPKFNSSGCARRCHWGLRTRLEVPLLDPELGVGADNHTGGVSFNVFYNTV